MVMKKSFLVILFLISIFKLYSQDAPYSWKIKLGVNLVNIQDKNVLSDIAIGFPSFSISKHLFSGISIGTQYSMNKIKIENSSSLDYYSIDGFLKYSILNDKTISPYFFGGYGFSSFQDGVEKKGIFPSFDVSETAFGGIGLEFKISDKIGINLSTSYRNADEIKSYKHLQHFAGISFNIGNNDLDNDGIPDKKDLCPEIPGLIEFGGCPDSDSDLIPDNEDKCPNLFGSIEMQGCPDTDGDGVIDKNDNCPEKSGKIELNGCPDSDNDNIIDIEDDCPLEFGLIENNGCPLTDKDNDGVLDINDDCPEVIGSKSNGGCPDVPVEVIEVLNTYGSSINFAASSDRILGKKTINILSQIKSLLDQYPNGNLIIEGHTSSDGDKEYNQFLSIKRAESVKKYLINLGVDKKRLESVGKGDSEPIDSNDNPISRARNRRVQFKTNFN